jgi:hypothetical protein
MSGILLDSKGDAISATNPLPVTLPTGTITIGGDLDVRPLTAADVVTAAQGAADYKVTLDGEAVPVEGGNTTAVLTSDRVQRGAAAVYRSNVSGVDTMAVAVPTVADNAAVAGSLGASAHYCAVAAVNAYGTSGPSTVVNATPADADSAIDITIPQVAGATSYRIYFCLCTPNPHFLLEITEAQRATGGTVDVVAGENVFAAADPATPGVITVLDFAPGLADSTELAGYPTTGWVLPGADPVDCTGYRYAEVSVVLSPDWAGAPGLTVVPLVLNGSGIWTPRTAIDVGAIVATSGLSVVVPVQVDGASGLHVLCSAIANCTAAITVQPV